MTTGDVLQMANDWWADFVRQQPEQTNTMPQIPQESQQQETVKAQGIEARYLSEFAACYKQMCDNLRCKVAMPPTLEQITGAIHYIQDCENWCRGYEPIAGYLRNLGFPALSELVEKTATEMRNAERIYRDMLQGTVNAQIRRNEIWKDVHDHWMKTVQGVAERRRAALKHY
ncbi:hypothetical protein [Methylocystis bryophila]|uniref:Uncharacterized protein n=1 Tax=Methylocystis bryophila TaxID=655015 RepID=A0A1W6MWT1_9HYPH|nr:hypothetical protein [Methylocystis bryophila]ARN82053.1 hypothetical protein B1812_14295 [Methylocystis bryophila]